MQVVWMHQSLRRTLCRQVSAWQIMSFAAPDRARTPCRASQGSPVDRSQFRCELFEQRPYARDGTRRHWHRPDFDCEEAASVGYCRTEAPLIFATIVLPVFLK